MVATLLTGSQSSSLSLTTPSIRCLELTRYERADVSLIRQRLYATFLISSQTLANQMIEVCLQ